MPVADPTPVPMPPGHYLRLRRVAAGKSPADVAAGFHTEPRLCELDRAALLIRIEEDPSAVPLISAHVMAAYLAAGVRFDARVLVALVPPLADPQPPVCRNCGCSWSDPCLEGGASCHWIAHGLCSSCTPPAPAAAEAA